MPNFDHQIPLDSINCMKTVWTEEHCAAVCSDQLGPFSDPQKVKKATQMQNYIKLNNSSTKGC